MTPKTYVIKREHRGRVNEVSGTIPELVCINVYFVLFCVAYYPPPIKLF